MTSRLPKVLVAVTAMAAAWPARAEEPVDVPAWRVTHRTSLSGRLNPRGLSLETRLTLNRRLYASDAAAGRDNFVSVGLVPIVTPATLRLGLLAELQPASFLNLSALAEGVRYLGSFRQMASFPSATSVYGDGVLRGLADAGALYATNGRRYTLTATLMLRSGPLTLRNQSRFIRSSAALRAGDRLFYDALNDLLVVNGGWAAANDLDLGWRGEGLFAGLRWGSAKAFYGDDAFGHGEDRSRAPGTLHRLGPLVTRTWARAGGGETTLLGHVGWWLANPNRTGQDSSALLPMAQVGLTMTGPVR
jgi:hypothetical protein